MTVFHEDMIFKNITESDAGLILEIIKRSDKIKKIWTTELRLIDPTTFKPDLIIELENEILIIEFQSTKVDDVFSRRCHNYVSIVDYKKETDQKVNLIVLSTAEDSKTIEYEYGDSNVFKHDVVGFEKYDVEKIINNIKTKLKKQRTYRK